MRTRVISACVAIALAIPFVWFGGLFYALGVGVVAILGLKEIIDLKRHHSLLPIFPSILAVSVFLLIIFTNFNGENFAYGATYMHLIITSLALLIPSLFYKEDKYSIKDAFYLIGVILFLGIAFNSFLLVREQGIKTFLYLVFIPMCTDTAAMMVGSKIGKHKMCPKISPKKSWEGFVGGLIFGSLIPSLLYWIFFGKISFTIIITTVVLSLMGQIGDLIFSKIKRENVIKDFSNIMPGHGGVLDRLDSTMVIFMSYIFLSYILF